MKRFHLGASRGKKIWISVFEQIKDFEQCKDGEVEARRHSIQLNPIDNDNKVVWSLEVERQGFSAKDKDLILSESEKQELINLAYEFAKEKGYIDKILSRCSK